LVLLTNGASSSDERSYERPFEDGHNEVTDEERKLSNELQFRPGDNKFGPRIISEKTEIIELEASQYNNRSGYDPNFLRETVQLPNLPTNLVEDCVFLKDDNNGYELKYNHFSIVMSKSRRLSFFTAVNIDGNQSRSLDRTNDRWYFDPRIDRKYQSGPELYSNNDLDRGHLIRRLDPVWGQLAEQANEDTFHFTNCSPQHKNLNQITWLELEDYILKNADRFDLKVSVFTGPIFREDDILYRQEFQIPAEFWKVVVIVKDDNELSATAYLQTQKNLIDDLKFAYGEYKTYQVPVVKIEALTKLDFGILRLHDPLANIKEAFGTVGRIIRGPSDITI
jgi:endonuclease G, mitochondrial